MLFCKLITIFLLNCYDGARKTVSVFLSSYENWHALSIYGRTNTELWVAF